MLIGKLLIWLIDQVRNVFTAFGLTPINELVFNLTADKGIAKSDLIMGTFTSGEWKAALGLWMAISGMAVGVLLTIGVGAVGLKLAGAGADDKKRAEAQETLYRLAVSSLLIALSGPIIYTLFQLNQLIVQGIGQSAPAVSFNRLWDNTSIWSTDDFARAVVNVFALMTEISLNFVYMMRKFALLVLVAIAPITFFLHTFESTREVTKLWFQELLSNLLMQTTHAILMWLFFSAYGTSTETGAIWSAFCFLLILQPTTNMIQSILTSGRRSNFTGMGMAAAAVGVTSLLSAGKMGMTAGTALSGVIGGGGLGGIAGKVAGQVAAGNMTPDQMAALGGATGMSAATSAAGVVAPGVAQAVADNQKGGAQEKASIAAAYAPGPDSALSKLQRRVETLRNVGGKVGATVGAIAGGGVALATGDAGFIAAGATLGGKVGRNAAGATAGITGVAGTMAKAGIKGAASAKTQPTLTASGADFDTAAAMAKGAGKQVGQSFRELFGGNDPTLDQKERGSAMAFNVATTLGHAVGGQAGMRWGQSMSHYLVNRSRTKGGGPAIGRSLEHYRETKGFKEGDEVSFVGEQHRTRVYVNGEYVETRPEGNVGAAKDNPVVMKMKLSPDKEGHLEWREVKMTPKVEVASEGSPKQPSGPHRDVPLPTQEFRRRASGVHRGRFR